ncbi:MAG: hypothetical protein KBC41_03230 [Candidatus Pacebacteria bacterium]|nr:hypothetical protein [Candidatus Paceibacterota bacterium]MBP9867060.1 hypothetical protein [Candidatus Paceibacterota bacterium]
MKTIQNILVVSAVYIAGTFFASAQYYYQNQYPTYQYQNYTQEVKQLGNCYYTNTNPAVYYGNCVGIAPSYSYTNTYQAQYPTYQNYYQPTSYTQYSPYYTYGYQEGRWHRGYTHSTLGDFFTGGSRCYQQNGYTACY